MSVSLSKERKAEIIASMRRFFSEKLQLELSGGPGGIPSRLLLSRDYSLGLQPSRGRHTEIPNPIGRGFAGDLFSRATDILGPTRQFARSSPQTASLSVLLLFRDRTT
jgi:hypothetical protein